MRSELTDDELRAVTDRLMREHEQTTANLVVGLRELADKKLRDTGLSPDSEYGQRVRRKLSELESALQRHNELAQGSLQAIVAHTADATNGPSTHQD